MLYLILFSAGHAMPIRKSVTLCPLYFMAGFRPMKSIFQIAHCEQAPMHICKMNFALLNDGQDVILLYNDELLVVIQRYIGP